MSLTKWSFTLELEADRVLYIAKKMYLGSYLVNGLTVVPHTFLGNTSNLIVFPDLPYHQIPDFWRSIKKLEIAPIPVRSNMDLSMDVAVLLRNANIPRPSMSLLQNLWSKAEKEVITTIEKVLPATKGAIKSIDIYSSKIGDIVTVNKELKFPCDIKMHLREDGDIYSITSAILSALLSSNAFGNSFGLWTERQTLVDWLIKNTDIGLVLKHYQENRVTPEFRSIYKDHMEDSTLELSRDFYKKLGLDTEEKKITIESGSMFLDGTAITNLTIKQKELLMLFVKNRKAFISTEAIAKVVLGPRDKFNLHQINQGIYDLRQKMSKFGMAGSYIRDINGLGYMML